MSANGCSWLPRPCQQARKGVQLAVKWVQMSPSGPQVTALGIPRDPTGPQVTPPGVRKKKCRGTWTPSGRCRNVGRQHHSYVYITYTFPPRAGGECIRNVYVRMVLAPHVSAPSTWGPCSSAFFLTDPRWGHLGSSGVPWDPKCGHLGSTGTHLHPFDSKLHPFAGLLTRPWQPAAPIC